MAKKNNLKPKAYAKNNIDRWIHLTGYELEEFSSEYYTRDQVRAIASRYGVRSYTKYKNMDELIQVIKQTDGYREAGKKQRETLYEKIRDKTGGESKPLSWYMKELKGLMTDIKKEQYRMTIDQKFDSVQNLVLQDENELRRRVFPGHMYFYEYEATTFQPYYDKFPLVYVLSIGDDYFYGANLHYLGYKERLLAAKKLFKGQVDVPKHIIHKYLIRGCKSLFLDLATYEWETASMLPVEDFVFRGKLSYDKELVWEETRQYKSKKLKGAVRRRN